MKHLSELEKQAIDAKFDIDTYDKFDIVKQGLEETVAKLSTY
jgi:hypothetical protein